MSRRWSFVCDGTVTDSCAFGRWVTADATRPLSLKVMSLRCGHESLSSIVTFRTAQGGERLMTTPYYQDDAVTLYLGDCREVTEWLTADVLVTDPPYPNNAGHFDDAIATAVEVLSEWQRPALVFWSELEHPPVSIPLVAVHIWHRTNVNGKPYEPIYQFAPDGIKRRSLVWRHCAINDGATGSRNPTSPAFASGHPTQKPVAIMAVLIAKTTGVIADPFAGSGSTLVAAKHEGRKAIGCELSEAYCELIAGRLSQGVLNFGSVS